MRYFPQNYRSARDAFKKAVKEAGGILNSHIHDDVGPEGEQLAVDTGWFGARDASNVLVVVSGTHGLEGYAGSGCQVAWLSNARIHELPESLAVLMVHALNPWGMAYRRRCTEDNIDLNRNFMDWSMGLPENVNYAQIHAHLCPPELQGAMRDAADAALDTYSQENGEQAFNLAVYSGQYSHPDGLMFGGQESCWSRQIAERILNDELALATNVCLIDIHTALGPYHYGTPIALHSAGSEGLARARKWFGDSLMAPLDKPKSATENEVAQITGTFIQYAEVILDSELTAIALEFGTYPEEGVLPTFRNEHFLWQHGCEAETAEAIKNQLLWFFYPRVDAWIDMVWFRFQQVTCQAIAGLVSLSRTNQGNP